MPRIRSIKPEFWTSEDVAECSPIARLLFIGLWTHSDDAGIHPAKPKRVKMEIFPADPFTSEEILEWIEELKQATLIEEYEVDGQTYWRVTGWSHQKIERPSYRFPLPDGQAQNSSSARRSFDDHSTNDRRQLDDGHPPEMEKDRERKKNTKKKAGKRSSCFVKPGAGEVQAYCDERQNGIIGQDFIDHYDRVGWIVGKNKTPMRDWRAAVRTWENLHRKSEEAGKPRACTAEELENWRP